MTGQEQRVIDEFSPKRARGDSGEIEQHLLEHQIEADKYLTGKEAMAKKNFGMTREKIIPPGTV